MEINNKFIMDPNQNNLYKYSGDLGLINLIKEKNNENSINIPDSSSKEKKEFLIQLANILENKLRKNIRLHQKGFEIYKQKLTSERDLILNSTKDIKDYTINQIIDLLLKLKNNPNNEKLNNYFSIGKDLNKKSDNKNNILVSKNTIKIMNKVFSEHSNIKNNDKININNNKCIIQTTNDIKNKHNLGFKNKNLNDPRLIFHSPSPCLSLIKKQDSKIIEENKNVDNHINFNEEQKIINK